MKIQRQWVPAAAIALLSSFGLSTSQENAELEVRIAELEKRADAVEGYLQNQAKSAEKLQGSIDEAEKAGFTFGINPESREILVRAWRAQASAVSTGVPGKQAKDDKGAAPSGARAVPGK